MGPAVRHLEPETEQVVYGLTSNLDSYNPLRIATHEIVDIGRDVARAETWTDRFSFLLRGPGWAGSPEGVKVLRTHAAQTR